MIDSPHFVCLCQYTEEGKSDSAFPYKCLVWLWNLGMEVFPAPRTWCTISLCSRVGCLIHVLNTPCHLSLFLRICWTQTQGTALPRIPQTLLPCFSAHADYTHTWNTTRHKSHTIPPPGPHSSCSRLGVGYVAGGKTWNLMFLPFGTRVFSAQIDGQ